jgi:hypothetical protein
VGDGILAEIRVVAKREENLLRKEGFGALNVGVHVAPEVPSYFW